MSKIETMSELQLRRIARDHSETVYMFAKSFKICLDGLTKACTQTNDPMVQIIANQVAEDLKELQESMTDTSHESN